VRRVGRLGDLTAADVDAGLERRQDRQLARYERDVDAETEAAYRVVRAWGFFPTTLVTWCKRQPGVGHYLRNNTEHVIFATRGRPMVPEAKPVSTWFEWPRGAHSSKPDAFYDLVESVSPGPYVELFARRARFGWDYWGDQSLGTAEVAA
jgi:N6-adenosine-specific RNA methylase IME4